MEGFSSAFWPRVALGGTHSRLAQPCSGPGCLACSPPRAQGGIWGQRQERAAEETPPAAQVRRDPGLSLLLPGPLRAPPGTVSTEPPSPTPSHTCETDVHKNRY